MRRQPFAKASLKALSDIDKGGHSFIRHDSYLLMPVGFEFFQPPQAQSVTMDDSAICIVGCFSIIYKHKIVWDGELAHPIKERTIVGMMRFDPTDIPVQKAARLDIARIRTTLQERKDDLSNDEIDDLGFHYNMLSMICQIDDQGQYTQPSATLGKSRFLDPYRAPDNSDLDPAIVFKSHRVMPQY